MEKFYFSGFAFSTPIGGGVVLPSIRHHSPLNGVWLPSTIATESSSPYFREGPFPSLARLNQYCSYGLGMFSFGEWKCKHEQLLFKTLLYKQQTLGLNRW